MQIKKIINILFFTFILVSSSWAQQTNERELTLEDCILHAIRNNLDVAVEIYSTELADISVSSAKEKFLPNLNFNLDRRNTNTVSFSWIEASEQITSKYNNYGVSLNQVIPTGGQFSVSLNADMNDSNQKFITINPRYGSSLVFSFTQPLLRNFGIKTSRREILVAKNNSEISENNLKNILLNTVFSVEESYWNLVFSIETLEVRKKSLKLARDLLEKNQKEVEIGTLAPKEILSAQAEVAAREADILQAETLVKNNKDQLKTLINITDEKGTVEIIPVDKPGFDQREVSLEESVRLAMENRPDLLSSRVDLENKDLDLTYARNQLLPALNLNANYWSPGVSGDQIIYDPNNPFGPPIDTIPGSSSDALMDALNFKYNNWSISLTLDIPLNTIFSRASVARANASLEQARVRMKSIEQKAFLEIKTLVRTVQTDYQRVNAYKIARELAEKKLEAEEAKLEAGLSNNYFVLQYQRDLANARSNELRAVIDYNLSLSKLDKALGVSLKNWNVKLTNIFK